MAHLCPIIRWITKYNFPSVRAFGLDLALSNQARIGYGMERLHFRDDLLKW